MANVNTVKLEHVDIWAEDIESSRKFYTRFFAGKAKRKAKVNLDQSDSYSIKFGNGPALELKPKNKIAEFPQGVSLVHPTNNLSFKFESKSQVDDLTQWILDEGINWRAILLLWKMVFIQVQSMIQIIIKYRFFTKSNFWQLIF